MPKRVISTFSYGSGPPVVVPEGDVYADDHPLVKSYPGHFEDLNVNVIEAPKRGVEQATAAPGEVRRGPGRPRKDA